MAAISDAYILNLRKKYLKKNNMFIGKCSYDSGTPPFLSRKIRLASQSVLNKTANNLAATVMPTMAFDTTKYKIRELDYDTKYYFERRDRMSNRRKARFDIEHGNFGELPKQKRPVGRPRKETTTSPSIDETPPPSVPGSSKLKSGRIDDYFL